jgi:uncharacterized membrane protein YhaH (DUF805 family)
MNWYIKALQNYGNFNGRASRQEYWTFAIISFCISLILGLLGLFNNIVGSMFLSQIYNLLVLIPSLSIITRRLHDIDKSGWWAIYLTIPAIISMVLIILISVSGDIYNTTAIVIPVSILLGLVFYGSIIWLLILLCKKGTIGENKYGQDPNEEILGNDTSLQEL